MKPTSTHESYDVVLSPERSSTNYWGDIWRFRELFIVLAWRDIKVRYKQAAIGATWAVIRPLLTMLVLTVIFSRVANLPSEGRAPYMLMVFAGMLPWFVFSNILAEGSNSLVGNSALISKIYFPRIIMPAASSAVSLADFAVSFCIFLVIAFAVGFLPGWQILFLPVFIGLAVAASLGPTLLLSALNVKYRDFRYIVPFVIQFGLYVSPVGFSSSVIPDRYRLLYSINPMVGVIDGFRWCLLRGESEIYLPGMIVSLGLIVVLLCIGVAYFRRSERSLADYI